jgi:two-component sensor histidine kinase
MLQISEVPIADVFITEELQRRAPKRADYLQEKLALQDLAAHMVDRPEEMLPRLVDLAMEMTGGVSAGLSLYEKAPTPGVFRWKYLRGLLSSFEGATTPRNFSPCGITLDQNGPVLSLHPERVYDWIRDADIIIPEVLLVPLYIGGGEPLGTLWIVSDQEGHFDRGHARVMTELAAFVGIALHMVRSEERLQRALIEQETVASEMSHRVKNLFAMTDGLIRMTARNTSTNEEMSAALSGRLHAHADAHALVRPSFGTLSPVAEGSDLAALVRAIVEPHSAYGRATGSRIAIDGPPAACSGHAINGIALTFHELATNAAKYGALTSDTGSVDISWRYEGDNLIVRWSERGGPRIEGPPRLRGFGSSLVENTIVRQFGGALDHQWAGDGLTVLLTIPAACLSG